MKEDVPFCMIVKQTAWEKENQPSWPLFQQDHHVKLDHVAGTSGWSALTSLFDA